MSTPQSKYLTPGRRTGLRKRSLRTIDSTPTTPLGRSPKTAQQAVSPEPPGEKLFRGFNDIPNALPEINQENEDEAPFRGFSDNNFPEMNTVKEETKENSSCTSLKSPSNPGTPNNSCKNTKIVQNFKILPNSKKSPNHPDYQPIVRLVHSLPVKNHKGKITSDPEFQPYVQLYHVMNSSSSNTKTADHIPTDQSDDSEPTFYGFSDNDGEFWNIIKSINSKAQEIENKKLSQVYLKKHNLKELKDTTQIWRETLIKCVYEIQDKLQKSGYLMSIVDILSEHGISPSDVGFDVDSMEFNQSTSVILND